MRTYYQKTRWVLYPMIFCLLLNALSGCAVVGPKSISVGRGDYNEAISKTEGEQMLLSVVKGRYGESFSLLAVSSVAANVRFRTNALVQAGIGPDDNFAGNLVPFSGGLAYEENPTISYAPVQGEKYLRQFMSPVPIDILILFIRSGTYSATYLNMIAERINDMRNPGFLDAKPDPRFKNFIKLNFELHQAGVLNWVAGSEKDEGYKILITGYAPNYSQKVREYLDLLGLSMPMDESKDIVLPVYFAVEGRDKSGIAISTRSTFGLIQIMRAAIEVPEEHISAGVTIDYPSVGSAGENIRIHASKDKPNNAAVAVRYRDYWFYIDDADKHTKMFFLTLRALWSVGIASATNGKTDPLLTIPVSR